MADDVALKAKDYYAFPLAVGGFTTHLSSLPGLKRIKANTGRDVEGLIRENDHGNHHQ